MVPHIVGDSSGPASSSSSSSSSIVVGCLSSARRRTPSSSSSSLVIIRRRRGRRRRRRRRRRSRGVVVVVIPAPSPPPGGRARPRPHQVVPGRPPGRLRGGLQGRRCRCPRRRRARGCRGASPGNARIHRLRVLPQNLEGRSMGVSAHCPLRRAGTHMHRSSGIPGGALAVVDAGASRRQATVHRAYVQDARAAPPPAGLTRRRMRARKGEVTRGIRGWIRRLRGGEGG